MFLQDLRQRYPATCGHLVTTSLMVRITSSPETRSAASNQPMIILIPLPPSPAVKRQTTPQPKLQPQPSTTSRRAGATSAGPMGRRTVANTRTQRPQTANAILTRHHVKGHLSLSLSLSLNAKSNTFIMQPSLCSTKSVAHRPCVCSSVCLARRNGPNIAK